MPLKCGNKVKALIALYVFSSCDNHSKAIPSRWREDPSSTGSRPIAGLAVLYLVNIFFRIALAWKQQRYFARKTIDRMGFVLHNGV